MRVLSSSAARIGRPSLSSSPALPTSAPAAPPAPPPTPAVPGCAAPPGGWVPVPAAAGGNAGAPADEKADRAAAPPADTEAAWRKERSWWGAGET